MTWFTTQPETYNGIRFVKVNVACLSTHGLIGHGLLANFMRFYHNPRCSKSRQALALLEERGVTVEIVRYLETGVMEEDLPVLASLQGIVRKKEAGAAAMATLRSQDDVEAFLRSNPKVLERPVLVADGQAVIGRPPENVLKLLE